MLIAHLVLKTSTNELLNETNKVVFTLNVPRTHWTAVNCIDKGGVSSEGKNNKDLAGYYVFNKSRAIKKKTCDTLLSEGNCVAMPHKCGATI